MKKFIIQEEKVKLLIQVFEQLGNVEVKGDSVIYLYNSRMIIKQVFESIKEFEEIKEIKEDSRMNLEQEMKENKEE